LRQTLTIGGIQIGYAYGIYGFQRKPATTRNQRENQVLGQKGNGVKMTIFAY
jgi:hypothetical protein